MGGDGFFIQGDGIARRVSVTLQVGVNGLRMSNCRGGTMCAV